MSNSYLFLAGLFKQTGPHQSITTAIRNILKEYKDGIGILKELIQNADDAGATTVKFLVDWRQGPTGSLLSPGLAECQGPALWAYNDAVFTDSDLENIAELAGQTKLKDLSRIGRFGLGFTAVYHLTDVPSFFTREHFTIFDPNVNHLQNFIEDRSRPGISIDIGDNTDWLAKYQDQFQLYDGIFDCNTMHSRDSFHYNGTLFRFPFRTAHQAKISDISQTCYDQNRIEDLVSTLCQCASTLLLFSQHITKVELYQLDRSGTPNQMELVLSVNKSINYRNTGTKSEEPFIKQCSMWWKQNRDSQNFSVAECPFSLKYLTISVVNPAKLSGHDHNTCEKWLVASASGENTSLEIARSPEGQSRGLLPCGGVAFPIGKCSEEFNGELFCFLPLSISTGLPVHVNGSFAIMSNRVEIWKRTNDQSQKIEVKWNESLMQDALPRAYVLLLKSMKLCSEKYMQNKFYNLWPRCDVVDMKSWEKFVRMVCYILLEGQHKLLCSNKEWMNFSDGFILGSDLQPIYQDAVEVLLSLNKHVFNIPCHILKTLEKFDRNNVLESRTLTLRSFMRSYFLPNIEKLPSSQRNTVVCFGLDRILEGNEYLPQLFKEYECVAVSQNGNVFTKPCNLVHPNSEAAELFSEDDRRLPFGNGLRDSSRLYALKSLGMVEDLDWQAIYERAQSITKLDYDAGAERSQKLIKYINQRMDKIPTDLIYSKWLENVRFIPVKKKPSADYPLPWKGSDLSLPTFFPPKDVFLPEDSDLIGSSCYIVDTSDRTGTGKLHSNVKDLLGFSSRPPKINFVIHQLDEAMKSWHARTEKEKINTKSTIECICRKIYDFLNNIIVKEGERNQHFLNELNKRNWLFLQGQFVQSSKVAFICNGNGAPFLFTLPPSYISNYQRLLKAMRIKDRFDEEDYISALYELQSVKEGRVLTDDEFQVAVFFINEIQDVTKPTLTDHIGKIPLPDTNKVLRKSEDVVVNLSLWLKDPDDNLKVHEKISPQIANALGAKSLKNIILKKYSESIGVSFGQKASLLDRLKEILDGYPVEGILKELVQNADDAQASEIHFIYDTRILKNEKVVTEKETSEEIQGPALCVYNDKPFTEKDLEGIQRLGKGGKLDSSEMTGKYGIGFNSVYHLTDCPSFLTDANILVILDPHCRYAVAARPDEPGEMFSPIDERFRHDFSDTLDGYLLNHFNLRGSTMFRFPLRRKYKSMISNVSIDMKNLLDTFQEEARKSLLFLNHIKKITLSEIGKNNKLNFIHQVETVMNPENEKKREDSAQTIRDLKGTQTAEIGWQGIDYDLTVKQNGKVIEHWLIQKCIGSTTEYLRKKTSSNKNEPEFEIPDGRKLGLFPRGGLAARLWKSSSNKPAALRAMVYCFLPLPENYTSLPVHINGHFALDRHRRGLWTETDGKGEKCKWNYFMKSCVLAPAYAALILAAKKYLGNNVGDHQLSCYQYHALFPKVKTDSPWKTLAVELYGCLGQGKAKVLPLLVPTTESHFPSTNKPPKLSVDVTCTSWLTGDEVYFVNYKSPHVPEKEFLYLLIRIGVPVLIYCPFRLYRGFSLANRTPHEVTRRSVVNFLQNCCCKINPLPRKLQTTVFRSVSELLALIQYCHDFSPTLEALPLLLTQDGYLREFNSREPAFLSEFGDLFPAHSYRFVHSEIVDQIPWTTTNETENTVRAFTVEDVACLLPSIFTAQDLKIIDDNEAFKFPPEGILSEKWFKRFWDYLQNYAKPEPSDDFASLECLSNWPLIPTTCEKLVKMENASTVLDMSVTGMESAQQENVRTFLKNLKCPVLNKEITFKEKYISSSPANDATSLVDEQSSRAKSVIARKPAITDQYVAHPHNCSDVLKVLYHMLKTGKLNRSEMNHHDKEIFEFLQFVQDNYKRSSELLRIIKCLPFHKALNGQFVTLENRYSSYALVPSGVPLQQLNELQWKANCCFLDSSVLPTLEKLYSDLGVRTGRSITQFYVEYVFRNFSAFNRDSQMQHLIYIKDEVHPTLPRGDTDAKKIFLRAMAENPCIPDKHGNLHLAAEFYDLSNKLFKVMFEDDCDKCPPAPFNDIAWLELLKDIGLLKDITQQLFLEFCETVAHGGSSSSVDAKLHARSGMLMRYLFSEQEYLRGEKFLSKVSKIKFIVPAKVEENLAMIHEQYQYPRIGHPPFIEFRNAVLWKRRYVTWTSAPILQEWAQPDKVAGLENLGICKSPPYTTVVDHLQNLAINFAASDNAVADYDLLHKITTSIYEFLSQETRSCSSRCNRICIDIGLQLQNVPCIFLNENKVFVKAEQLSFNLPEKCDLRPFLYPVPEELIAFRHFLKRLGTTEKIQPLQMAIVLNAIHEHVGENELSIEQDSKVKWAMHFLFKALLKRSNADTIDELYLPSQSKRLVKSSELIYSISSRFIDEIEKLQCPILLSFKECKLKKDADVYINALPKHLRPKKFEQLVREDIDPECKVSICALAEESRVCKFQNRFQNLLRSDELQEGLKRLMIHTDEDPQQLDDRLKKLTNVQIKCVGSHNVKIQIILRDCDDVLSSIEDTCYATQEENTWWLYMQHESRKLPTRAAGYINKILGGCIKKIDALIAILDCSSPSEISEELDKFDIARSVPENASDFTPSEDDMSSESESEDERSMVRKGGSSGYVSSDYDSGDGYVDCDGGGGGGSYGGGGGGSGGGYGGGNKGYAGSGTGYGGGGSSR